jgi:hypothetical protein
MRLVGGPCHNLSVLNVGDVRIHLLRRGTAADSCVRNGASRRVPYRGAKATHATFAGDWLTDGLKLPPLSFYGQLAIGVKLALSLVQARTGTESHQKAKPKARNPEAGPAEPQFPFG